MNAIKQNLYESIIKGDFELFIISKNEYNALNKDLDLYTKLGSNNEMLWKIFVSNCNNEGHVQILKELIGSKINMGIAINYYEEYVIIDNLLKKQNYEYNYHVNKCINIILQKLEEQAKKKKIHPFGLNKLKEKYNRNNSLYKNF